jgi:uncharacterized phage protein (TIGR01671 family)
MQEIKFRFWDGKSMTKNYALEKLMVEVGNVRFDFGDEIMQYTGLKDRNNKEIYEGDIMQVDYNEKYKAEVYWGDEGLWCLKWNKEGKDYNYRMFACEKLKVVGNIYENPDLLKP